MNASDDLPGLLSRCDYEPIDAYAIVGDCRSAALVSRTGSVDWLCMPHFSAPSVFAALLDRRHGGRLLIRPRDIVRIARRYRGGSAVLKTTFECASGRATLTDFMSIPAQEDAPHRLFRIVECEAGEVVVDVAYQPRPDYARAKPDLTPYGDFGWMYRDTDAIVLFDADATLALDARSQLVGGTCRLVCGERRRFVFAYGLTAKDPESGLARCEEHLDATLAWWRNWVGQCAYGGFQADAVVRSCLTLKLLAYRSSGAVMAALTTSLPESLDSGRNWDYRYCWLRDTSLLLQSFIDLGFQRESKAFLAWLLRVGRKPRLQPFYDLNAQPPPEETVLPHLEGYLGRGPVRIGNAAHEQLQLDIYGEVLQTACSFVARGGLLNDDKKRLLSGFGAAVCRLWREPDASIWEPRTAPRHYTYSKLMCWVALERLIDLQTRIPLGMALPYLRAERARIRREIETHGFDARLGSYVGYFGGTEPDASLLLMARYGYADANDPRLRGTFRYIHERLAVDGFLYRYPPGPAYDGIGGTENLFAVCSFWAVDYLARAGEIDAAIRLFERLLRCANDVGLFAEQFEVNSLRPLGNYPQAFSHSGLITAALAVEQALAGRRGQQITA